MIFKLNYSEELMDFKLGDTKESVKNKVYNTYGKDENLRILETKYNILVELKEFDRSASSFRIVQFTFDETEKLIHMKIVNTNRAKFIEAEFKGKTLKISDIIELINTGEDFYIDSHCPILNSHIDFTKDRQCGLTYLNSCKNCFHRSQKLISSKFPDENIYLRIDEDNLRWLSMTRLDKLDEVHNKYGFQSIVGGDIKDNEEIIKESCE